MVFEKPLTWNGRLGSKKVKTGCKTCKVRRVKCDEAKPECRRCINSGRKCDGYSRSPPSQQQSPVDWQPKDHDAEVATLTPERAMVAFKASEQERRSFDFYRDRTASSLAHTLDSTFWTDFILSVSHSEPAVRYALVAIGALNERLLPSTKDGFLPSTKDGFLPSTKDGFLPFTQDRNLKLALNSYNKSIKHLTTQMQHGTSDLIALLTCILFICVEFLQDNLPEALTLVHQGCAILRSQRRLIEEKDGENKSESQQAIIKHHVMPIFNRLTVISALAGHPASMQVPGEAVQDEVMPFTDLIGARSSLYVIMDKGHAIMRESEMCKWLPEVTMELLSLRVEHAKLTKQLAKWHLNFSQLQNSLELAKDRRLVQAISLLSMYFTTTSIWLSTCLERAQTSYDAYRAQFKQIVEAAELFINLSEGQPQSQILFTFEMGLVPPLYFTASRCRFPSLRRRAVSLILRAPGKEGMWDRAEMAYTASTIIKFEEGGDFDADDVHELPKEAARLHDVQLDREDTAPGQRKSVVRYLSKPDGLDCPYHIHREYFDV